MTHIFIQVRSDSTRLPDKYKRDINGKSLIQRVYETCTSVHPLVVAIIPEGDRELIDHLREKRIPYFEGSKHDLIDRYHQAMLTYKAETAVRVTGDCPCLNPLMLNQVVQATTQLGVDFGSNAFPENRTTIDGEDVEVLSLKAIMWLKGRQGRMSQSDQEHVTQHIYNNLEAFEQDGLKWARFDSHIKLYGKIKTSVDSAEDLEFVRGIV